MLVGCCVKEVLFTSFANNVLTTKKGTNWMKFGGATTVLSGIYMGNTLLTGIMSGNILEWKGNSISG